MKRNQTLRRGLSVLLSLVMCLSLLPATALAEETETGKAIRLGTSQINGGQASSVYFGNYQQSSDGNGGFNNDPIKWRVLSNADGKLFLLADQNLDVKVYSTWSTAAINWNNSTLRTWVNGTFLNAAFSNVEQGAIAQTYVYNATQSDGISNPNPSYSTSGGSNTTDKIFLLSIEEANNTSYFTNMDYSRGATNTAYVASKSNMNYEGKNNSWWLRSPGKLGNMAAYVGASGSVNDYCNLHRPAATEAQPQRPPCPVRTAT